MIINHKVEIDFTKQSLPEIEVMQGDRNSRSIEITLKGAEGEWNAPEGTTVCVGYCRADGTKGLYDTLPDGTAAGYVVGNVVTLAIVPQVMATAGVVQLSVSLLSGDTVISTFPVVIHVRPLPGYGGSAEDYVRMGGLLPVVNNADNGKILQVVGGKWEPVTVQSAEEAGF